MKLSNQCRCIADAYADPAVHQRLLRMLKKQRVPNDDRDDLLQEAWTAALSTQQRILDIHQFILTTLYYRCIIYFRRRRGRGGSILREALPLTEHLEDPGRVDPVEELHLSSLLTNLSTGDRRILVLRAQGFSYAEIGQVVVERPETVRKRFARVLLSLQEKGNVTGGTPRPRKRTDLPYKNYPAFFKLAESIGCSSGAALVILRNGPQGELPSDYKVNAEGNQRFAEALGMIAPKARCLLLLRAEGLSYDEISTRTGLRSSATLCSRSLVQLRACLSRR